MFNWTDDAVARLRAYAAEKLTAAQIAARMDTTRNAIIGKCGRLKIPLLALRNRTGQAADRKRAPRIVFAPTVSFAPSTVVQEPLNIPLVDLEPHHCREVVSPDGVMGVFCGHPKREGSSYCEHHARLNHYPAPRKPAGAAGFRLPERAA